MRILITLGEEEAALLHPYLLNATSKQVSQECSSYRITALESRHSQRPCLDNWVFRAENEGCEERNEGREEEARNKN